MRWTTRFAAMLISFGCAMPAMAESPRVVTDIAPVHSLVARVMAGVGTPDLLVSAAASPHDFALRPSQARALGKADVVIWMGAGLTPWLGEAIDGLAGEAVIVSLLEQDGSILLDAREEAVFDDGHDHGHGHGHHDRDKDGHGIDPHAWLDPRNARLWLVAIAAELGRIDPDNAALYDRNALASVQEIERLETELRAALAPARNGRFVVRHDAYRYFEARFDLAPAGAVARNDAATPGPRRLRDIREVIAEGNVRCVFTEEQLATQVSDALVKGTSARIAVLDPLGSTHTPGPALYGAMMRGLAGDMAGCLSR